MAELRRAALSALEDATRTRYAEIRAVLGIDFDFKDPQISHEWREIIVTMQFLDLRGQTLNLSNFEANHATPWWNRTEAGDVLVVSPEAEVIMLWIDLGPDLDQPGSGDYGQVRLFHRVFL